MSKPEQQLLDKTIFDAAEVASMAGIRVKDVANWTDRGLSDPYHAAPFCRRGRGQARKYSLRDALRFALMKDLAGRYQVPLPLGKRICGAIFSEAFSPRHCGYLLVEGAGANHVGTSWFSDETQLVAHMRLHPMRSCLVVNTALTFTEVRHLAAPLLAARGEDAGKLAAYGQPPKEEEEKAK